MNLKYKILAVLAAGIALTACGGSGTPASTPASSAVPASSHVAEEGVTEPINMLTWTLDDLDDTQTITFVSAMTFIKKKMLKNLPLGIRSPSTKRGLHGTSL